MKVTISEDARADLHEIAAYVGQGNPRRAGILVREIRARCKTLSRFPSRHQLVSRYEANEVRRVVYGAYLIFYHIVKSEVVVLRVLHGAMDYERLLFSNDPSSHLSEE